MMFRLFINYSLLRTILFSLLSLFIFQSAFASVVMTGSRIIYPSEKNLLMFSSGTMMASLM